MAAALNPVDAAYQALRSREGQTTRTELGTLPTRDIERFHVAIGTGTDDTGAAASVVPVPWLCLTSMVGWDAGPPDASLGRDGSASAHLGGLAVDGLKLMFLGQDAEVVAAYSSGVNLSVEVAVSSVRVKQGRSGPFLMIEVQRDFFGDDEMLVRCIDHFAGRA